MQIIDYILLAAVVLLAVLALWHMRQHKNGCAGCKYYDSCKKRNDKHP